MSFVRKFADWLRGQAAPKERAISDIEAAWRNLEKGQRYFYPERGWAGRFQGEASDSFTAWMIFEDVGQCGVDPRKLVALPERDAA